MPDLESVLTGLNEAQREAATALRGPVAILAGAGTGKTTTITHRIACQVRERDVRAVADPRGDVHGQGRGRAPNAARGARRRGRRGAHVPLGGALAALEAVDRAHRRAAAPDPRPQGAGHLLARERAPAAAQVPAAARARGRDRVGEEPDDPARAVPRRARRPRAADPRRPDAPCLRRLRAAQGLDGAARFRGHARTRRCGCSTSTPRPPRMFARGSRPSRWTSTRT